MKSRTKQQLLVEMKGLQARMDAMERRLQETSETRYRRLFETARDGVHPW